MWNDFIKMIHTLLHPLFSMQRASWEQGLFAQALLEYHIFKTEVAEPFEDTFDILPIIYGLVHDAIVRQGPDGRFGVVLNGDSGSDKSAVDPACIGEAVHFVYDWQDVDKTLLDIASRSMLEYILNQCPKAFVDKHSSKVRADEAYLYSHRVDASQIWSDSVYMLPSFLVSSAVFYSRHPNPIGNPIELLRAGLSQIELARGVLQSTSSKLWRHIYDFEKRGATGSDLWGVGNGWVCGGIIRVFNTLARTVDSDDGGPLHDALLKDPEIVALLKSCYETLVETLRACIKCMRQDGLFHNVLDDSTTFVETNLAQQLTYTIYRLLDLSHDKDSKFSRYLHFPAMEPGEMDNLLMAAEKMFEACKGKVDRWGFVRDVCGSPTFDKPGTAAEGQAWAILMHVAKAKFERNQAQQSQG